MGLGFVGENMVRITMVVGGVLAAGCATVHPLPRAAAPAELERFNQEVGSREVSIGVARLKGRVVLSYDVETRPARQLRLTPTTASWTDPSTGAERAVPLQALAWAGWPEPGASRLTPALKAGGLGLAGGAVLGASLGFLLGFGPDLCVGGGTLETGPDGFFAQRCFMPWPPKVGIGAAIGAGVGLVGGAILGALLGQWERVELTGPVAPPPPPAPAEPTPGASPAAGGADPARP